MSDFKIVKLLDSPVEIIVNVKPRGVYDPGTTYGIGDSVSYNNSSYIAIQATTGNLPTNTTYWQLLASSSTLKLGTTAKNLTGTTIPKGSVVYFNGASGNLPTIALAQANTEATSSKTVGITAVDIANNSNGEIVVLGLIDSLDTSALTVGLAAWLSPSVAGGLTNTQPVAPDHSVFIGTTTRSHPSQGTIEINIQNGFRLEDLHNVLINSLADNQVLKYDALNLLWKNETLVKADVGLGNVDNTSDINKPVSTAQALADTAVQDFSTQRANHTGTQPSSTVTGLSDVATSGDHLDLTNIGLNSHSQIDTHISSTSNPHSTTKSQVGLGNADDTSDVNKPVSIAQQAALDLKINNNVLTVDGDLLYRSAGVPSRLPIGSPGQLLKVSPSNLPLWADENISMFFSDGHDGNLTLSGPLTLSDDAFYDTLTLNAGAALNTAGYKIFCKTLDLSNAPAFAIRRGGNNGGNSGSQSGALGGAALNSSTTGGSGAAGAGATGVAGVGAQAGTGTNFTNSNGGNTGAGGQGGAGTPNAGGASRGAATVSNGLDFGRIAHNLLRGQVLIGGGAGAPGGSAGGGDGVNLGRGGGGGGSGAGVIAIYAETIITSGSTPANVISCIGGSGGNGASGAVGNVGGGGGGAGGGGGYIYLLYANKNGAAATDLLDASGGNGGNGGNGFGTGTGARGGQGGAGGIIQTFNVMTGLGTKTSGVAAAAGGANVGIAGGTGSAGGACRVSL